MAIFHPDAHEIKENRGDIRDERDVARSGKKKRERVKMHKLPCYLRYSALVAIGEYVSSGFTLCSSYFMRSDATQKGCAKMNFDTAPKEYFLKRK
ncbi:hypothetical protein [Porphyromonas sp. COT-108 OH1349]|uniref:hypothetical protein n=1 Tax=Porphyromonas sp. COT-108 OH1349 TaxID=1537504 RepID=UPI00052D3AEF|nr:hypothetical protein [Porphyromonas sp. COT-108 OH1349]KGN67785.1 hypothetical protein JT26_07510 [Porphyromonas sp. COT-108 OH1349]